MPKIEDIEQREEAVQGDRRRASCCAADGMQSHNLTKKSVEAEAALRQGPAGREGERARAARACSPDGEALMPRVKRSVTPARSARKVLDQAKGYWGSRSPPTATRRSRSSTRSPTRTATARTRSGRSAGSGSCGSTRRARANGLSYNQFIAGLKEGRDRARPQGARRPRGQRSRAASARIAEQAKVGAGRRRAT